MGLFKENACRLCVKVFCCVTCRVKHEENDHEVDVNCDICVYGRMFMSKLSDKRLMEHVKEQHLPVHCVRCDKVFEHLSDVPSCKCPAVATQTAITPVRLLSVPEPDYESPPITNPFNKSDNNYLAQSENMMKLTTSTPMQLAENRNIDNISNPITPVEASESKLTEKLKSINNNYSGVSPNAGHDKSEKKEGLKKVTFCETSIVESTRKSDAFYKDAREFSTIIQIDCKLPAEEPTEGKDGLEQQNRTSPENSSLWQTAVCCNDKEKLMLENDEIESIELDTISNIGESTNIIQNSANAGLSCSQLPEKQTLWSSMASMMKNVVQGIYHSSETTTSMTGKRQKPEDGYESTDFPQCKKIKLYYVHGRKAIRPDIRSSCCQCLVTRKLTFDKATQTESESSIVL